MAKQKVRRIRALNYTRILIYLPKHQEWIRLLLLFLEQVQSRVEWIKRSIESKAQNLLLLGNHWVVAGTNSEAPSPFVLGNSFSKISDKKKEKKTFGSEQI